MKLRTSYKKQKESPFSVELEIIQLPRPCSDFPKATETIVISGIRYYVCIILYRHNRDTYLILTVHPSEENTISGDNKNLLAIAESGDNINIIATIKNSGITESFSIYDFPHSYKEYIEKDGLVYETSSVEFLEDNKYSVLLTDAGPFDNFLNSFFSNGKTPHL